MTLSGRTQAGWPAYDDFSDGPAHGFRFQAGGQRFWAASGPVAHVAGYFINRYAAEVEPIDKGNLDDWSFAPRLVRGSSSVISNHAGMIAWDLNATAHPLGIRTLGTKKKNAISKILRSITDDRGLPVLRHGAFYSRRVDEMHVEVNATAARIAQASSRVRGYSDYIPVKA